MGRIPESNPRHRTKQQLITDITFVLNSNLHFGTKTAVLTDATWVWSEYEGKYKGCGFWSEAAARCGDTKLLRHDHAVPRKLLLDWLLNLRSPTQDSIQALLDAYCKAAVIIKSEDALLNRLGLRSKMPSDWDGKDPWARYKAAGIVLCRK